MYTGTQRQLQVHTNDGTWCRPRSAPAHSHSSVSSSSAMTDMYNRTVQGKYPGQQYPGQQYPLDVRNLAFEECEDYYTTNSTMNSTGNHDVGGLTPSKSSIEAGCVVVDTYADPPHMVDAYEINELGNMSAPSMLNATVNANSASYIHTYT